MPQQLNWGVIGAAGINGSVVPAIQASSTGRVIAIASRDTAKAEAAALKYDIPSFYGSYEELLKDERIDAVYIPLPNHLHKEWTIRAAEAGKHVLCEKPLALDAAEAQHMVDACEKAGVKLAEAFMYRHHPRLERIKEVILSGEIGELRGLRGAFTFNGAANKDNVRFRAEWGGGSVYDVGCYPISAARYILGSEPLAATAHALFSAEHGGVDMMCSGLLEFPGDIALTFDCGMWADFRNSLEIVGTDGRIEIPGAFLPNKEDPDFVIYSNGKCREDKAFSANQYTLQADRFARSVWGEDSPLMPAEDPVLNMRVIDAVLKSAREKARIAL
ncbi:gfo/Idh/MocA family oxidoreductase [Cohnella endophytica]|uniref:Gfo/Idh/MocA family oxidoreductase n=1 Tax=Cohnella endophytica TaxID=2419778 RepID=A0A494X7V1_9BACL|nr:Gfo/Idh/MocA family oxidoreductase [Cohnella endophytica]RKP44274.1 gfo/Idh/MocA family oxidoreductase [Cohnella endophytica]